MARRCSCMKTRKSDCELDTNRNYVVGGTTQISLEPTHQTHIQSDKMHTQPYMPPLPRPERLPWESVPKQFTVRQVHEHGGTPMETGQDLTEQASQRHQTHYQPKHIWRTDLCIHSDLSRPHTITLTCS